MKIDDFVKNWKDRGYEKGETHVFWLSFLRDVMNVSEPEKIIQFEVPVKLKHKSFIDGFLVDTKVIIEQKSITENLNLEKSQSDGTVLTPFEQAQRYGSSLPYSMRPRWIIVSNFKEFLIYDMETMSDPQKILLEELPEKYHAFDFMIDANKTKSRLELEISIQAGKIVGKLYDALLSQYIDPNNEESLQSLNKLCVRLVFCLYAESTGLFGKHKIFRDYLEHAKNIRRDLIDLFEILDTPIENRDPYLADDLKIFPYVNGGLFADKNIEIPNFTDEIKNLLFEEASSNFNWAGISPTIFGSLFESTLNPVTRRIGGMHYTSLKNIHKVIDNLFLDDLTREFESAKKNRKKLLALQEKMSRLKFLDPACGSGNFLTETYLSLRRLENEILKLLDKHIILDVGNPIKVSINQFYGIEINDFAVSVSQTALLISELQMADETSKIIHREINYLPLRNSANIYEGNSLKIDWHDVVKNPNYIFGNPPYVGYSLQTAEQKSDMRAIFEGYRAAGKMDYVCAWIKKASDFIHDTKIEAAFVTTKSICKGEQVGFLWKNLFDAGIRINFAYRSFEWKNETTDKKSMAQVHCVVVGFANFNRDDKIIYDEDQKILVRNINGYLLDGPNICIETRSKPICDVPKMISGSMPADDGHLIIENEDLDSFIKKDSRSKKFIRPYMMGEEFIHNKARWCLWLVDASPKEIHDIKPIYDRVKKCKDFRLSRAREITKRAAKTPWLFVEIRQPTEGNYIIAPKISSERREYIPMDFLTSETIAGNMTLIIPNATKTMFGILNSSVYMAWMRAVAGRFETRYIYSTNIVYNNFPFPNATDKQRSKIESTAQKILDARANYPDSSLADLYNEDLMPADLRKAHIENDRAVLEAYGFDKDLTESEIVAKLFEFYQGMIPLKK